MPLRDAQVMHDSFIQFHFYASHSQRRARIFHLRASSTLLDWLSAAAAPLHHHPPSINHPPHLHPNPTSVYEHGAKTASLTRQKSYFSTTTHTAISFVFFTLFILHFCRRQSAPVQRYCRVFFFTMASSFFRTAMQLLAMAFSCFFFGCRM